MPDNWFQPDKQGPNASVPRTYVFPWAETVTITTGDNTDVSLFRKGDDQETDLADTYFGTPHSQNGNRITLADLSGLPGGERYIISIRPTVDGVQDEWWQEITVPRATGRS